MESFLPLVGVLAGGALTIVGGYFNQMNLHKRQRASEARSRAASKLEDVGRQANKIRASALKLQGAALQVAFNSLGGNNQQGIPESESEEFLLILRLYEPSLLHSAKTLIQSEEDLRNYVATMLTKMILPGSPAKELIMELSEGAGSLYETVRQNHAAFMSNLSEKFVGYRI